MAFSYLTFLLNGSIIVIVGNPAYLLILGKEPSMANIPEFTLRNDLCGGMLKFKGVTLPELERYACVIASDHGDFVFTQIRGCGDGMLALEFRRTIAPGSKNFRASFHALGHYLKTIWGEKFVGWDVAAPLYIPK